MSSLSSGGALATSFRALRHRNFRLYWSGQLVSLIGSWMQSVAQSWLMHRLTHSAFMLGLLGFAQFVPVLLLALPAGVIVDRVDRRRLLLATQTLMLLQATVLAALVTTGAVKPWMVLVLAFVYGCVNAFDLPGRQSFVIEMVGREDLPNGIALNSAAFNTARIAGPAVAGILVAVVGEQGCFWINAASFLAVIAGLVRMRLPAREPVAAQPVGSTLREGLRYVWASGPIRTLLVLLACTTAIGFQYSTLLPVYARDLLHRGPGTYGLLLAAFGAGSLVAALRMTQRLDRWALRRNLLVGLTIAGFGMVTFAWSRWLPLSVLAGFSAGYGMILYVSSTNTLVQLTTSDEYRGRVMGFYTLMFVGTAPLGALAVGTIAQRWGAPVATSVGSLALLGGALWVAARLREIAAREAAVTGDPGAEPVS